MFCKPVSVLTISLKLLALGISQPALSSTTMEFQSPCQYVNPKTEIQASTVCKVNYGTLSVAGGARYILYFPNQSEVWIYHQTDGTVTTNGISSSIASGGDNIVVITEQGEIFIFRKPKF